MAVELLGQPRAVRLLKAIEKDGRFPPLLFAGPSGVGKRTAALQLARSANCEAAGRRPCGECSSCRTIALLRHPDVRVFFPMSPRKRDSDDEEGIETVLQRTLEESGMYQLGKPQPEPDPKHKISIEVIRWLRREMAKPPMLAPHRFFIILNAHRMTAEAANAFLKTLEEPQRQTALILTTDRPNFLFDTIRSRCRLVRFAALGPEIVQQWLVEHQDVKQEEAELAALVSDGSIGKALRFAADPDDFLAGPALDFFAIRSAGEADVLSTMSDLDKAPLATVVFTFLFLHRQALLSKLGLETGYARHNPAVKQKAAGSTLDHLRRATVFLSGRLEDCRLNLNRKLFLYTLLSALRRSKE